MDIKFWTLAFWQDIGYSLGSSVFLAKRLIKVADIHDATLVIELGAGMGQVTEHILTELPPHTRFITIENDAEKYQLLYKKYGSQCEIHEMSAAHIDSIVQRESVDVIISTLPLGSISSEGVDHILRAAFACLKPGGVFVQYQYWMYNRKDIQAYFTIEKTYWEPRNIGPAFIYRAIKK